jgi:hypothetical protein
LGITLHDAKDPSADAASADAQLMTGFRLLIAEEERRKIKERTVRGQRAKLESGAWPGGKPCFGWKLEGIRTRNAHPVPDLSERRVLDQVFAWLVREGKLIGEICELLNATGIKSRTGIRWSHAVLRKILANPTLHTGWFIWGSPDSGSADLRSHKTKIDRDGRPIYGLPKKIHLPSPPFTKLEFQAIQRALNSHPRAQAPQRPSFSRPLSGKLFGKCGMHYTGTSIAGKDYDVYRCTGNRYRGNETVLDRCGCSQINAQKIEQVIWTEVSSLISNPIRLQELAKDWLNMQRQDEDGVQIQTETLDAQESKLRKALSLVRDDYYLADSKEQVELKARISKYRDDLESIERLRKTIHAHRQDKELQTRQLESLTDLATRARSRIQELDMEEQREIYNLLRIRVVFSEIKDSRPTSITIFGQIDSRIADLQDPQKQRGYVFPDLSFTLNG